MFKEAFERARKAGELIERGNKPLCQLCKEVDYATRKALDNFDAWNDSTGVFPKGTGYYYECKCVIEDAVKIGIKIAREGIAANLSEITGDEEGV